ncbi:putative immunoglobulin-like protein [Lupinus albus]|uniref:Putative immunoglobulin-like protein n=1 Tax=Lupinus albus TaxID=3870 RepID=A0A6A4PAE6_LUPAL|nr:putative immunoglobulin-like protein [Lupinus albus]
MHISYNISPLPSFNITMIATMTIMKPNFGDFNYGNGSLSGARIEARKSKDINFVVNMWCSKISLVSGNNLINEINSGMLKFRSYAKLSGTVHLMKIVNKRKTIEMDCILNLNFTSHSIHHSRC